MRHYYQHKLTHRPAIFNEVFPSVLFYLSMKQVLLYDCVSADDSPAIMCVFMCRQKRNSQGFWLSPFYLKLMIATIVPMLIKSLNAFLVVFKEKSTCVVPFFILCYWPSQIIITVLYGGGLTRHLQEITRRWRMGGSFQIWASWHFLLLWHLFWHFMTQRPLVDICLNIFFPLFDKNALLTLKAKQSLRCWWFTKKWLSLIIVQHHHY